MKSSIIVACCILGLSTLQAQEPATLKPKEETVQVAFNVIEEVPIFPGCEAAISEARRKCFHEKIKLHVIKNLNYPSEAHEKKLEERIFVLFSIEKDGSITNIQTYGKHDILKEEAQRIISQLPTMKPGIHRGKAVSVPYSVPITFKI